MRPALTAGSLRCQAKSTFNCLAGLGDEALTNELQFYEWHAPKTPCILAIRADPPLGFIQGKIEGKAKDDVPDELAEEIRRLLTQHGVPSRRRLSSVVRLTSQIRPYGINRDNKLDDGELGLGEFIAEDAPPF